MIHRALILAVILVVSCLSGTVAAVAFGPLIIPGSSNPWLAGMPDGSTAMPGDSAPTHSPVLVPGLNLSGGSAFAVTGAVQFFPGCCAPGANADGSTFFTHLSGEHGGPVGGGPQNGMASVTAPVNALMGVFLDSNQPDLSAAPSALDFSTIGLTFASLSPELKQPFFIGDGLTGTGSGNVQSFIVPNGATRLFLGTMDEHGWFDNSGQLAVSGKASALEPVPEPTTMLLFGTAAAGLGLARWRQRRQDKRQP